MGGLIISMNPESRIQHPASKKKVPDEPGPLSLSFVC